MDFDLGPHGEAVRESARTIFGARCTPERLTALDASPDGFDAPLWSELAAAGLLGVAIPEAHGGGGLGLVELCHLLEEAGRALAVVPLWPTLVCGALAVSAFAPEPRAAEVARAVAAGDVVLTGAPWGGPMDVRGDRAFGTLDLVADAHLARWLVAAAQTGVYLVSLVDASLERQATTDGRPHFRISLDGARAEELPGASGAWLRDRAAVGLCSLQVGVSERALEMTASYTTARHQFGRPLATFQAVQQRAADAYIDVSAMRLTTWQAAWRLANGLDATHEVAVAAYWAAEGGARVAAAAQHLHGGIGVDLDYPLHRYTRTAKQIELMLGGATARLAELGDRLAEGD